MANETPSRPPPPFMANAILNFHFDFLNPSLICALGHLTLQHRGAVLKLWPTHFLSLSDKVGALGGGASKKGDLEDCANQTYST